MHMKISDAGIDLIKRFEGCKLQAYPDPGTGGEPVTIGYGHTGGVKLGDTCTQEQADAWLRGDLEGAERVVNGAVRDDAITQGMFDALVSFQYNTGALRTSTLLKLVNDGQDMSAAQEFKKWVHAGGKVLPGLVTRRNAEMQLFLS
jgi:lysozyme